MTDRYDERDLIAIQNTGRFDANEGIFFARQLEYVKSRTYDVKRPMLNAMRLFPRSTEAGEGATTITYRQYDGVGMAKIIANYANDLPRADVKGKEFTSPIRSIGDAYGYSTQEIRSALMAGTNLESRKATMAARAQEELINRLAWAGDTVSGLPGLLSNANIPALTLASDGTGSSKAFTTKTPAQIVRDVQALINLVRTQSKDIHKANAVWMPLEQLSYIAGLKNDTGTDTTVLEFLQRNNPGVSFEAVLELDGAGASGADRMYAGEITADNLTLEIPMMLKQYAPQQQGLEFVVPMESRFGGVLCYYPLALAYADGI
jgi:hypothetical protein